MKNFKVLTLSLALLGAANIPAITILEYCGLPPITLTENTRSNHTYLHAGLLLANLFIPAIVNDVSEIKANGWPKHGTIPPAIAYKHVTDFYQLFKKEVVAEGQTPKTFRQKWAEFAQTHKTSAALIQAQLAALALSGICGAYTQRKYAYIGYCYARGKVVETVHYVPENWKDGRLIYTKQGTPSHRHKTDSSTTELCSDKNCKSHFPRVFFYNSNKIIQTHSCMY